MAEFVAELVGDEGRAVRPLRAWKWKDGFTVSLSVVLAAGVVDGDGGMAALNGGRAWSCDDVGAEEQNGEAGSHRKTEGA